MWQLIIAHHSEPRRSFCYTLLHAAAPLCTDRNPPRRSVFLASRCVLCSESSDLL